VATASGHAPATVIGELETLELVCVVCVEAARLAPASVVGGAV
jgi:hypothetical protein